jgi:hypothetical protein
LVKARISDLLLAAVGATIAAGKLERAFVGFGAAVAEVDAVGKARFTQQRANCACGAV